MWVVVVVVVVFAKSSAEQTVVWLAEFGWKSVNEVPAAAPKAQYNQIE